MLRSSLWGRSSLFCSYCSDTRHTALNRQNNCNHTFGLSHNLLPQRMAWRVKVTLAHVIPALFLMTFLSASRAMTLASSLFWFFFKSNSVAVRAINEWRYWKRNKYATWPSLTTSLLKVAKNSGSHHWQNFFSYFNATCPWAKFKINWRLNLLFAAMIPTWASEPRKSIKSAANLSGAWKQKDTMLLVIIQNYSNLILYLKCCN